jgi:hypothetical protein
VLPFGHEKGRRKSDGLIDCMSDSRRFRCALEFTCGAGIAAAPGVTLGLSGRGRKETSFLARRRQTRIRQRGNRIPRSPPSVNGLMSSRERGASFDTGKSDYHVLIPPRSPTLPTSSAGLFVRRTSCHSKCQSAPRASATQGNHADETSPRCSMGCRGWGDIRKRRHLPHLILRLTFGTRRRLILLAAFFVPFVTL